MDRTSLLDALRALAPAPFERHLPHETLDALHETVVQLGLAGSRDALLARIDPALVAGLPDGPSRAAQLATDLAAMNGVERLTDGTVPLRTWVENARRLSSVRGEARVFAEALAELPVHASVKGGRATEALVAVEAVVSIGRLPRTGGDLFGREKELAWLDRCWADGAHVVTIVAWGGVGKSALVNGWLRGMAADGWRGAERVYAWSFYSQGTTDRMVSADEFISAALSEFGDNDPTAGSPWDKGERLAKLVKRQRTLLLLDGLEPLQWGPGPEEGKLKDPSLEALIRELGMQNKGLCLITSRIPVHDLQDCIREKTPRVDLNHLSAEAGAQVLRARGAKGTEEELREAAKEI